MRIIPEWRKAWKLATIQVLFVLQFAPEALRAFMDYAPDTTDLRLYHGALIIATIARMVYQPKVREDGNEQN